MTVWFTADTHFGHRMMAEMRGYASVEEHDEALLDAWNARVQPSDEVWLLGDFSFERDPAATFRALNGLKNLATGNHDEKNKNVLKLPWVARKDMHYWRGPGGERIVLCHYPLLTWRGSHQGAWHLHGHSHGQLNAPLTTRLDVGIDVWERPISLGEVAQSMSKRTYRPVDHHGVRS